MLKRGMIFIFMILDLMVLGQNSDSMTLIVDKVVHHFETSSVFREKVNWEELKPEVYRLAKPATSITELKPAFTYILKTIGDEHGRVFSNNGILAYHYGDPKPHQSTFDANIYSKVQSGQYYNFEAKILPGKIGYIRIVGLPMGDNQQMTKAIEDEVCKIYNQKVKSWIFDLRYNGGGNMFPMVEGIAQIIGDGNVGGTKGVTQNESSVWKIKDGNYYYDDYTVQREDDCKMKSNAKIAVLTSLYTASSGEALAVILKGRKNTRFFGGKTLGMITSTNWVQLHPAITMCISTSYYKDRNSKVYDAYIDVDEEMPFVAEPLSSDDATVAAAIKWLKTKK